MSRPVAFPQGSLAFVKTFDEEKPFFSTRGFKPSAWINSNGNMSTEQSLLLLFPRIMMIQLQCSLVGATAHKTVWLGPVLTRTDIDVAGSDHSLEKPGFGSTAACLSKSWSDNDPKIKLFSYKSPNRFLEDYILLYWICTVTIENGLSTLSRFLAFSHLEPL